MIKYFILFSFLLVAGCGDENSADKPTPRQQLTIWEQDSTYFSWDGEAPVLLLGAGNADTMFLDPEYETKLKMLAKAGGNWVTIGSQFYTYESSAKRKNINKFLALADELGIQVDISLRPEHNIHTGDRRRFRDVISSRPYVTGKEVHSRATQSYSWQQLLDLKTEAKATNLPLVQRRVFSYGQQAAEGIAGFNRALLAGAAAVRHAERPYGEGFSGAALASIRAARTVERLIPFWALEPAMEIVPDATPNSVYAATDGKNGYVLYLPTAAAVEVKLDVRPQVPLRVTVVGYLGTQKSEVLRPPYGDSFVLSTEEPRGGWMVIKPL